MLRELPLACHGSRGGQGSVQLGLERVWPAWRWKVRCAVAVWCKLDVVRSALNVACTGGLERREPVAAGRWWWFRTLRSRGCSSGWCSARVRSTHCCALTAHCRLPSVGIRMRIRVRRVQHRAALLQANRDWLFCRKDCAASRRRVCQLYVLHCMLYVVRVPSRLWVWLQPCCDR